MPHALEDTSLFGGVPCDMRTCPKCNQPKDEEKDFYRRANGTLRRRCKDCIREDNNTRAAKHPQEAVDRTTRWRKANPGRASAISRAWQLRHPEQFRSQIIRGKYKVDFKTLWEMQKGLCAACGEPMLPTGREKMSACVDHDKACCSGRKSCGKCVRGLIHWRCNLVLGYASDDPRVLHAAISYLEQWQKRKQT